MCINLKLLCEKTKKNEENDTLSFGTAYNSGTKTRPSFVSTKSGFNFSE